MARAAHAWVGLPLLAVVVTAAAQPVERTGTGHTTVACPQYAMLSTVLPDHVPAAARRGAAAFLRAKADSDHRRFLRAARGFVRAARLLRAETDPAFLAENRMAAYRNAAHCYAMANRLEEARRELERAKGEDSANAAALTALLANLPAACRTGSR